jgi:hypothetical protein
LRKVNARMGKAYDCAKRSEVLSAFVLTVIQTAMRRVYGQVIYMQGSKCNFIATTQLLNRLTMANHLN